MHSKKAEQDEQLAKNRLAGDDLIVRRKTKKTSKSRDMLLEAFCRSQATFWNASAGSNFTNVVNNTNSNANTHRSNISSSNTSSSNNLPAKHLDPTLRRFSANMKAQHLHALSQLSAHQLRIGLSRSEIETLRPSIMQQRALQLQWSSGPCGLLTGMVEQISSRFMQKKEKADEVLTSQRKTKKAISDQMLSAVMADKTGDVGTCDNFHTICQIRL
jgi:uncharacterized protein YjiS (DUF1127 family)